MQGVKRKSTLFWISIFAVTLVLVGCSSGSSNSDGDITYKNEVFPQTGVMTYELFDEVVTVNVKEVIMDLAPDNYDTDTYGVPAENDDQLVQVKVSIENTGTSTVTLSPYAFSLEHTALNDDFSQTSMMSDQLSDEDMELAEGTTLEPGESTTVSLYFMVIGRGLTELARDGYVLNYYDASTSLSL